MKNDIFHLPEFFSGGLQSDPFIHFYTADRASVKSRIVYERNMIAFLRHGSKEVFSAQSHARIDSGSILLLNSGSVLMSQSLAEENDFESILLFFSDNFISEFLLRYSLGMSGGETEGGNLWTLPKNAFLTNFEQSLSLLKDIGSGELHRLKVEELLLYLLRQFPVESASFLRAALTKADEGRIRQVVNENLDKGLSVGELAFLCNMSVSTFKRHFTDTFNSSPKKYFTGYRMKRAQQLLRMRKRVSEVYAELGYESLSSFSTEFKKHFGISPREFRNGSEPL